MSGGVDSSVSALVLKEQGYEVIGLFMKNWEEVEAQTGLCHAEKDFEDVAKVCHHLKIPYHSVNFTKEYEEKVFKEFLEDLKKGFTPNPDILCNKEIKFKTLLNYAKKLGAEALATGHYAQIDKNKENKRLLLKGSDRSKDQSYFLYTLGQEELKEILFPVGNMEKKQLRLIAQKAGLATAEKKDSTGICFIGKRNFKEFIGNYLPLQEGPIMTLDRKVVGKHVGSLYYTIGQRKGLNIGGPGEAWFVVDKDIQTNTVFVVQGENHPALFSSSLEACDLCWVLGFPPPIPWKGKAKIRYRQEDQDCIIVSLEEDRAQVRFLTPQRAITLAQSIVFYEGNLCIGGGKIISKEKA